MTRSLEEVITTITAVRRLATGTTRSDLAAREVERIEAEGPPEAKAYALFALIEAYTMGGEPEKLFLPFTRLVRWWDEHPELFDEIDRMSLFWSFKWAIANLMEFPTVPAGQIEDALKDMRRRYALAGHGLSAVALCEYLWARMGSPDAAENAYRQWIVQPRDEFSECAACEASERADYLFASGRVAQGIDLIESSLVNSEKCTNEPAHMLSQVQLAYLDSGDAEKAARSHRLGMRLLDDQATFDVAWARHVQFLARSGNGEQALSLLSERETALTRAATPYVRWRVMTTLGAGVRILARERPQAQVRTSGRGPMPLDRFDDYLRTESLELAQAFDKRSGTTEFAQRSLAVWHEDRAAFPVDLSVLGTSGPVTQDGPGPTPQDSTWEAVVTGPVPGVLATAPNRQAGESPSIPDSPDQLLALAESIYENDGVRAARLYERAAQLLRAQGALEEAGLALAEAAECGAREQDAEGAAAAFRRALSLLWAADTSVAFAGPVVTACARQAPPGDWAHALQETERWISRGEREMGTDTMAPAASELELPPSEEALAAVRRRVLDLKDTRARLLASLADAEALSAAEAVAEEYARMGRPRDAAHAFWLAGKITMTTGDPEEAVDSLRAAVDGFGLAGDPRTQTEAVDDLTTLLRSLGRPEEAEALQRLVLGS